MAKIDLSLKKENAKLIAAQVERILSLKPIALCDDRNSPFVRVFIRDDTWIARHWFSVPCCKEYLVVQDPRFSGAIALQEIQ